MKPAPERMGSGWAGGAGALAEGVHEIPGARTSGGGDAIDWSGAWQFRSPDAVEPSAARDRERSALPALFAGRVVHDGTGMIKLDVPCIAHPHGRLPVSVEVNWPMILANAVARLYLVADANREPVLAQVLLIPDIVPPHVCLDIRVEGSGYVRAVVECGDGSLLEVNRWVWMIPSEP